jgi:prepilin-type processing-associated H-X9-DG protein
LKQIGLATQNHLNTLKFFPTGGWGYYWVGDPDRGFDKRQCGGWAYNILPWLDEKSIHDMGKGMSYGGSNGGAKSKALGQMMAMPAKTFSCPSRRSESGVYPINLYNGGSVQNQFRNVTGTLVPNNVARGDYCINAGDQNINQGGNQPGDVATMDTYTDWSNPESPAVPGSYCTGVSYYRSQVPLRAVKDGLSHTYLVGEKFLYRNLYGTGEDGSDNEFLFTGWDNDLYRSAGLNYSNGVTPFDPAPADRAPLQDTNRLGDDNNTVPNQGNRWGSAHPSTLNMVMCDGSVQTVSYGINLLIHRRLHNRADGFSVAFP